MQRTTPSAEEKEEELARIGIQAMPIPQETIDLLLRIHSIPDDRLPTGPAREALYELALRRQHGGYCVDVYTHSGYPADHPLHYVIELRTHPSQDGRYTLAEWQCDYAALRAEALARQVSGQKGGVA